MTDPLTLTRWATWREIHAQPAIWHDWGQQLDVRGLRKWIASLAPSEVWFCGAGTSAYIGDIFVGGVEGRGGPWFRSIPSTDLVSRPHKYLTGRRPLVVNFGRSGNSAESIGTLDALDALCPQAPWLNITCNSDGALARVRTGPKQRVVVLPEITHDTGFAMTSSFSTMLLTALALFDPPCKFSDRCSILGDSLSHLLPQFVTAVGAPPERAVYLGTGPLAFAAREAALKVMELSAGQIPAIWDSVLGFRHGPKSFVTSDTAITVFTSIDKHVARYEADLVAELRRQFPNARVQTIGPAGDIDVAMPFGETWAAPLAVASAQVASVIWSDALGLNVDDPFSGQGTLSRVVADVKLYPVRS